MDATALLAGIRLMPVIVIDDDASAAPLAQALLAAGIGAIEVTLRTPAALKAIERIAREVPDILVGAGTVVRPEQFAEVRDAGAAFAVSPGATEALLNAAFMPFVPGAVTASECLRLLERGYRLQKFFPAESVGGVKAIAALAAPLPEVRFCPTGGITSELAPAYFSLDCVACVGGSWFVSRDLLAAKDFASLERAASQAVERASG